MRVQSFPGVHPMGRQANAVAPLAMSGLGLQSGCPPDAITAGVSGENARSFSTPATGRPLSSRTPTSTTSPADPLAEPAINRTQVNSPHGVGVEVGAGVSVGSGVGVDGIAT